MQRYNHVMFDIETLGQGVNSVITSIAATVFDIETGNIGRTFHKHVRIQSCISAGLVMETDTILWWLNQTKEAQQTLLNGQLNADTLEQALDALRLFLDYAKNHISFDSEGFEPLELYVWGRGPRFDQAILTNAYQKLNRKIPWDFRNERCVRTMEHLRPKIKQDTPKIDTGHGSTGLGLHDASLDAEYQIAYVCRIYHDLNNPKYIMGVDPYRLETDEESILSAITNVATDSLVLRESKEIIANEPNDQQAGTQLRLLFTSHYK